MGSTLKNNEEIKEVDALNNMVRFELFSLFPNVQTLTIQMQNHGFDSYSFSLLTFLNVISQSNLHQIIINNTEHYHYNWMETVWKSDEEILKKEYAANNFKISLFQPNRDSKYQFQISKV